MTPPWIIARAAAGLIAGPRIRASVFTRSTEPGQPPRRACRTLALLAVAALTGHQPGHLARAAIGAAALACFYLALSAIRPDGIGLGDAKLAASVGAALGWISWQALLTGTFTAFALAAVYGGVLLVLRQL